MKIKNIFSKLQDWCPEKNGALGDNFGIQIKFEEEIVQNILIALDCSERVIEKAILNKCNLIVTHHPFFWPRYWKNLTNQRIINLTKKIKKANISVFSLHTNYDEVFLKKDLIKNIEYQKIISENKFFSHILLKKTFTFNEISNLLKEKFFLPYLQINRGNNKKINKIVFVPGSCGAFLEKIFLKKDVDLIVTGDLKWNDWIWCRDQKQNVICLGHQSEQLFIERVIFFLKKLQIENNQQWKIISHYEKEIEIL